MPETEKKYSAPALEKGLDIIELLANFGEGLTQSEIAKALDRSQGEIYRMLTTLVARNYVNRSISGDRYSLGLKMFSISQQHSPIGRIISEALPRMRSATRKSWQSCHLGMENNGDIVVVGSSESPGNWGFSLRPGTVIGLWNTGTGRVLAAYSSPEQREQLIANHKRAIGEPDPDLAEFEKSIKTIQKNGFAKMKSATVIGVTNLSFPIFGPFGDAIAVLTCPYIERIDSFKIPEMDEVIEIFKELSSELSDLYCGVKPK